MSKKKHQKGRCRILYYWSWAVISAEQDSSFLQLLSSCFVGINPLSLWKFSAKHKKVVKGSANQILQYLWHVWGGGREVRNISGTTKGKVRETKPGRGRLVWRQMVMVNILDQELEPELPDVCQRDGSWKPVQSLSLHHWYDWCLLHHSCYRENVVMISLDSFLDFWAHLYISSFLLRCHDHSWKVCEKSSSL